MIREEIRDQVATSTYILYEILDDSASYINNIDRAMDIAEAFIKEYPLNTNWEKLDWEETLYCYYHNYKK